MSIIINEQRSAFIGFQNVSVLRNALKYLYEEADGVMVVLWRYKEKSSGEDLEECTDMTM